MTPAGSFALFALVGSITWIFAYLHLPELSGVSLNDVHSSIQGDERESSARYEALDHEDNIETEVPRYVIE